MAVIRLRHAGASAVERLSRVRDHSALMGISSIEETWVAVTWMSGALAIEFGLEARRERLAGAA